VVLIHLAFPSYLVALFHLVFLGYLIALIHLASVLYLLALLHQAFASFYLDSSIQRSLGTLWPPSPQCLLANMWRTST
jgi:hypothetical protein